MTATGEVEKKTAKQPPAAAAKEKKTKAAAKEKKTNKTTTKTASHPPYFDVIYMIKEALLALKEKSGSSPYAIAKYMEDKHKNVLPPNFRKILGVQLKNSAAKGKLNKIKASYKLSAETGNKINDHVKEADVAITKKPTTAKPRAAAGTKRKAAEVLKKKASPKKKAAVPKKKTAPKSIKSPAAKKAKKASAA